MHLDGLTAARATGDRARRVGARAIAGHHTKAARLLRTAAALRASVGAPLTRAEHGDVDRVPAMIGTAPDPTAPAAELHHGRRMSVDDHVAGLHDGPSQDPGRTPVDARS
jgi:hypothetical protein